MGVCDLPLMDKVCGTVDFVSNPAGAVTDGIGAWLAKSAGELAATATDLASDAVNMTTAIDLGAKWFRDNYELLLPIGLALTVGAFCIQLMTAAWRRDERALAQAAIGTMTGVLFSFCAIAFTSVAITVVDALSDGLFQAANSSVDDAVRRIVKINMLGALYPMGWAVPVLIAVGCAVGAFLYWGVMVARKVGILILVTLAVFAGAGGGWEVAKKWRRGWIEATATLIVSKLLMTVVFLIGVSALGKTETTDGMGALSDAMAGIVVMVLVLLCPYATYKFVHWASDGGGQDDLHRTSVAGLAIAAGAAKTAGSMAMQVGTGTPAPQGPSQVSGTDGSGVATGINPAGGSLSKEGIDAGLPKPQSTFRYGEDPNASGDKGRALIQRPGIPALITRPGERGGSGEDSPGTSGGTAQPAGIAAPGSSVTRASSAPTAGPSPTGSPTPESWTYPSQPPSAS
ncbi:MULTISPECIES: ATP-binding protein [unclassified Streptomyces]|uniref:SCO6881 family protein n=1 Tax=unclassified Streptomyces TaxID=2593676 RepID=UPI00225B435C|nr:MULTISPECIES: ATP-binding protein [unclassified Streptomyces]MCX4398871.1 ATP-binding protein [Streptomyces sp. NBC_01767]WSP51159.1 ATP-binding protein [Streptomyces sp. NBC_01243]